MRRARILIGSIVGLLVVGAATLVAVTRSGRADPGSDDIPLGTVKRGTIDLEVHATGELQASRTVMITAPAVGGDSLQITHLAHTGEPVKKGDVILEFDPSEQNYKLEQSRSELQQAEQEIAKANADAAILAAQDKVALLKAHYAVRKAELDVQKNELVSKIDAEKNTLALEQAHRALAELEKDMQSHADSGKASIYLARQKYNKAKLAMDQAQENLDKMKMTAPIDGLVSIQKNFGAAGGIFFTGMSLPDYHPGDQVQAGSPVAQVVDPMEMNLVSHISERDHSNVHLGQPVDVTFYAMPSKVFRGTVKDVGGTSQREFFETNTGGTFDVTIQLAGIDARLRPGLTAKILFVGDARKNVLYVPRLALFMKDGKRIAYVKHTGGYEQREVTIESANESRAVVQGLDEGAIVALVDPTVPHKAASGSETGGAAGGTP
jgi:multidrug efflux pump subunit AcrA (membrane-fusion protein)